MTSQRVAQDYEELIVTALVNKILKWEGENSFARMLNT
jgi:hypothetical protein